MKKALLILSFLFPFVAFGQAVIPQGNGHTLNINKGGFGVDSFAQVAPVTNNFDPWYGRYSDFKRVNGKLYWFNATDSSYKLIADASLQPYIYVKDFGAKGDSITNDTKAIQDALDFADSIGGGTLLLEPGKNYRISYSLLVGSNTTIIGHNDTLLPREDDGLLWHDSSGVYAKGCAISGKNYDDTTWLSNITIEGIILPPRYKSIGFGRVDNLQIRNCIGLAPGDSHMLDLGVLKNSIIENNWADSNTNSNYQIGGYKMPGQSIDYNYSVRPPDGSNYIVRFLPGEHSENCVFRNNVSLSQHGGFTIDGTGNRDIYVYGNVFKAYYPADVDGNFGISISANLDTSYNIYINNNTFVNKTRPLYIGSNVDSIYFTDNNIHGVISYIVRIKAYTNPSYQRTHIISTGNNINGKVIDNTQYDRASLLKYIGSPNTVVASGADNIRLYSLDTLGNGYFGGTVIGKPASDTNEFVTLSQLNGHTIDTSGFELNSRKVQDLSSPDSTTYPSTGAVSDAISDSINNLTWDKLMAKDSVTNHDIIINQGANGTTKSMSSGFGLSITSPTSSGWSRGLNMFNNNGTNVGVFGFLGGYSAGAADDSLLNYAYISTKNTQPYLGADLKVINGKVGINLSLDAAPQYNLHVHGDMRIDGLPPLSANPAISVARVSSTGVFYAGTLAGLASDMGAITVETDPVLAANIKWGTATLTGDNSQMSFTILHTLSSTPTSWSISANDSAAATALQQGYYVTADGTNLTITFLTAPATGNFKIAWVAYK